MRIHLPACRAMRVGARSEHRFKAFVRALHFTARPRFAGIDYAVLPFDMIVGVYADLMPCIARAAHQRRAPATDIRAGQQRAVHQRFEAVVGYHRCAGHFLQKAATENAPYRATCVIGAEAE